jgi:aspartate/methionine/tyrosine aminotransferase
MTNSIAEALNTTLRDENPVAFAMLSARGKAIFFPVTGILGQTADARGKTYNATIGIALEQDGSPMYLPSLLQSYGRTPKDVVTYSPSFGEAELRTTWQTRIRKATPSLQSGISLPVVTAGITHALDCAGALFVDAGDAIILPDKFWDNYRLTFENNHSGTVKFFETFTEDAFNVSALEEAVKSVHGRKKILLLNFPNNPCGYTPTHEEVEEICALLHRRAEAGDQLVVFIDDAYYGLVFEEGVTTESLFGKIAGLHENILAVKIDGATKEDCAWGLRVGFLTFGMKGLTAKGLQALEHKAAGMVRSSVSNACHHSQSALMSLYSAPSYEEEKRQKFALLQERYREVRRVLAAHPEFATSFTPYPFNSGYFLCVQLADGLDAETVRQTLLTQYDTGVIAIGSMIRIAYSALRTEDISPVFQNLHNACITP